MVSSDSFEEKHALLVRAGQLFPFDDRFLKAPERLDFYVPTMIDPHIGVADALRALSSDPFAPDMLNGLLFFALRADEVGLADYTYKLLLATEPGYSPPYLVAVQPVQGQPPASP